MRRVLHEGQIRAFFSRRPPENRGRPLCEPLGPGCSGESVGQDAALQVASKFELHVAGYLVPNGLAFTRQREVGLQVLLDEPVEDGLLGSTTGVDSRAASLWTGGHVGGKA